MKIIADDRERGCGVIEALQAYGHEVAIARLEVGDYRVEEGLLIERKTVGDFALSIMDGRLFSQANSLAYRENAVLILEGRGSDLAASHVSRPAFQGALITISLVYRIPILRSLNPQETADHILCAADQLGRSRANALRRPGHRPKGLTRQKIYALQGFPGIGPRRAGNLLHHFGSIEKVLKADEADRATVPGIGPEAARRIRSIVKESTAPYNASHEIDL